MIPYFYTIEKEILSQEAKEFLISFGNNNLKKFIAYKSKIYAVGEDGNNYNKEFLHSEITALEKSCTLPCWSLLMMHKPNVKVIRHVDDPNKRNCVLSVPLWPKESYPSTLFFKPVNNTISHDEDLKPVTICSFENMKPTFLNTQRIHSVENIDSYRFNYQLCFENPFLEVVELYKTNKLFV